MTEEFGVRAERDLQTPKELWGGPERIALSNGRWYRERRPSNLIDEGEMLAELRVKRQQIRLVGQVLRRMPSVETFELFHGTRVLRDSQCDGTQSSRSGCALTRLASRIPHLASRIPT
jgi:hypothetical protein